MRNQRTLITSCFRHYLEPQEPSQNFPYYNRGLNALTDVLEYILTGVQRFILAKPLLGLVMGITIIILCNYYPSIDYDDVMYSYYPIPEELHCMDFLVNSAMAGPDLGGGGSVVENPPRGHVQHIFFFCMCFARIYISFLRQHHQTNFPGSSHV